MDNTINKMEKISEINHSLLSKLPLGVQSLLKSLPFSDYSLLLISGVVVVIVFSIVFKLSCKKPGESYEEPEVEPAKVTKASNIKVKIPNTKKSRRGAKRKAKETEPALIPEETKEPVAEISSEDDSWEKVESKKNKRKTQ